MTGMFVQWLYDFVRSGSSSKGARTTRCRSCAVTTSCPSRRPIGNLTRTLLLPQTTTLPFSTPPFSTGTCPAPHRVYTYMHEYFLIISCQLELMQFFNFAFCILYLIMIPAHTCLSSSLSDGWFLTVPIRPNVGTSLDSTPPMCCCKRKTPSSWVLPVST